MRQLIWAAAFLASAGPAMAQDVQAGRELAQRWCASCHLVAPGQTTATSDSVPSFMAIAARPNVILTPHVAWASDEAQQALADQLIDNIEHFVAGDPRNLV